MRERLLTPYALHHYALQHSLFKVSHFPARFGGHTHCGSEDIMVLVCHVILKENVLKGSCDFMGVSCDFMGRRPSR